MSSTSTSDLAHVPSQLVQQMDLELPHLGFLQLELQHKQVIHKLTGERLELDSSDLIYLVLC